MTNVQTQNKKFDLEDRTLMFAKNCMNLVQILKQDQANSELTNQLIRSACSVGSNYREANESISKKEFFHRACIARREAKESKYWLELLLHAHPSFEAKFKPLIDESLQLLKILSAIVQHGNREKST